jgi:hypothetical protein
MAESTGQGRTHHLLRVQDGSGRLRTEPARSQLGWTTGAVGRASKTCSCQGSVRQLWHSPVCFAAVTALARCCRDFLFYLSLFECLFFGAAVWFQWTMDGTRDPAEADPVSGDVVLDLDLVLRGVAAAARRARKRWIAHGGSLGDLLEDEVARFLRDVNQGKVGIHPLVRTARRAVGLSPLPGWDREVGGQRRLDRGCTVCGAPRRRPGEGDRCRYCGW